MSRKRLSIVVLTKDEESNIEPCLKSVVWADEFIVIDDNSSDKTCEIARALGARVFQRPLNRNFSFQRNFGMDQASGDWILQMDADERVTEGLRKSIEDVLVGESEFSAYKFRRCNNFCGKFLQYGGENEHWPLRLFKRGKAKFAGDAIHETAVVDGAVGTLKAVMEHYNFPDVTHYVVTQNFYTELESAKLFEEKGLLPEKALKRELLYGPVKLFFKIYIKRQGYRDGIYGLVFAVLSGWRRFLLYAKYWDEQKSKYERGDR